MRRIAILDAPSNLGLRPPTATSVPGCAKAPGALRDHGLVSRLHARDAGCLTPPRYDPGEWRPGDGVCHASEIATYSRRLADRIGGIIDAGEFPVVLGGDCSIVLGSGLAMHRLGEAVGGRIGLVFVDGHSDFRHPGNASYVGAAAGEDLALVTGRGQADLAAMEGRRPYFRDIDVIVMGIRAQDEYRLDLQAAGIVTRPVPTLRAEGAARSAQWARDQLVDCAGYWVHLDLDVLDPAVLPAVDAPSPGGIAFPELELLLAGLVDTPHCLGVEITVFDPDYDVDGGYAEEITSTLVAGLAPVRTVAARPDLVAARRDLAARTESSVFGAGIRSGVGRLRPAADRLPVQRIEPEPAPAAEPAPASDADPSTSDDDHPNASSVGLIASGFESGALGVGPAASGEGPGASSDVDPVVERRAAAAADSVALAAAGMSDGGSLPGAPEEGAAPATTLLGVEEAGEVEAAWGDESDSSDLSMVDVDATDDDGSADHAPEPPTAGQWPDDEFAGIEDTAVESAGADHGAEIDHGAEVEHGPEPEAEHGAEPGNGRDEEAEHDPGSGRDGDAEQDWNDGRDQDAEHDQGGDRELDAVRDQGGDREPDGEHAWHSEQNRDDERDQKADPDRDDYQDSDREPHSEAGHARNVDSHHHDAAHPMTRPLGSAPLLDSEPLPATRPGMLRPRATADPGFTLPAQRPAFDLGPEEPADIT